MLASGFTVDPPVGSCVPPTQKPTSRLWVGRLHYSLSSTLSAHFRWCVGAYRDLTFLPSTSVLGSRPDYREARLNRSIRHPTYPYLRSERVEGGGLNSDLVAENRRIPFVLLRSGR